jgi:hypothetical protein
VIGWVEAGGDDAVIDAGLGELGAGLPYQLTAVHQDQHAATTGGYGLGDGRQDDGLAGAGCRHQQRSPGPAAIGEAQIGDGLLLVGAEVHADSAATKYPLKWFCVGSN